MLRMVTIWCAIESTAVPLSPVEVIPKGNCCVRSNFYADLAVWAPLLPAATTR